MLFALALGLAGGGSGADARAQESMQPEDERIQILTDPESVKKKVTKDKNRPAFEFYRSKVAPFDVLPYVKQNHWSTIAVEMQANEVDYVGMLRTASNPLRDMPNSIDFRREARLLAGRRGRLVFQAILSEVPKEWPLDLARPDSPRYDSSWQANLLRLPRHQMLVVVLSKDSANQYAAWNRMGAIVPESADSSSVDIDKIRYYRLVIPTELDSLFLAPHPLTWSTISHVVWDGISPDLLSVAQQQAMLDWIHWGGQLILPGGAGQSFALFQESFLGPYLPADSTGETIKLGPADLDALSKAYRPPLHAGEVERQAQDLAQGIESRIGYYATGYDAPAPIVPEPKREVYFVGMRPREGSSEITIGDGSKRVVAIERRVGRGRITMLALDPSDPAIVAWKGLDTFVRRVVLRRPEEPVVMGGGFDGSTVRPPQRGLLSSQELSWFRIASRDLGRELVDGSPRKGEIPSEMGAGIVANNEQQMLFGLEQSPAVADWLDDSRFPLLCREVLEGASGIMIPSASFVSRIVIAYLIAVIPINWLICRVVFRRKEWTWALVPVVALGFAITVERVAARNLGFDTAADEIDLLELEGNYPRGHLTRVGSLYSGGRTEFSLAFPDDPTALALPMNMGRSIRGEDVARSSWLSYPVPTLVDLGVQPRSQSMYRAEQMTPLAGGVRLEGEGRSRVVKNETNLELRDAVLVEHLGRDSRIETWLGVIAAGSEARVEGGPEHTERVASAGGFEPPRALLDELATAYEPREENRGEVRLVAWTPGSARGEVIEPAVDRHRGFTLVVVHLKRPAPPRADDPRYDLLARPQVPRLEPTTPTPEPPNPYRANMRSSFMPPPSNATQAQEKTEEP